jgi:hypothetical protein
MDDEYNADSIELILRDKIIKGVPLLKMFNDDNIEMFIYKDLMLNIGLDEILIVKKQNNYEDIIGYQLQKIYNKEYIVYKVLDRIRVLAIIKELEKLNID